MSFTALPTLKHKLLKLLTPGVFLLIGAFSVLMVSLSTRFTSQLMLSNAEQLAHSFAQQAVLALLTASTENAAPVLEQMRAFPDVAGVGLWSPEQQILVFEGQPQMADYYRRYLASAPQAEMHRWENAEYWYLAAAVLVKPDPQNDELSLEVRPAEPLGYALLVFSKASLTAHSQQVILISLAVVSLAVLALFWLISRWVQKITQPLRQLSEQMQQRNFRQPPSDPVQAGSLEIQQIAAAYQQMLATIAERDEQLRQHQQKLETLVEIRTRELTTARDVALTASRHKSEFLANMSHELRTPIQSIMGYLDLTKEQLEFTEFAALTDDLNRAQRNAERLLQMINSLLDLSKIEAGRMELHPRPVLVSAIVQQSVELIKPLIQSNRLEVQLAESDALLQVDVEKLVQVLVNLLSNAGKFTHNGIIRLHVSIGLTCQFRVSDNGIGMTETALSKIFAPFYQVDGSQSRQAGGTGLGLAISRQFIELMGGTITVTSRLGKGTEFCVSIPFKTATAA